MSFQQLLQGGDCSGGNPLSKLIKNTHFDSSYKEGFRPQEGSILNVELSTKERESFDHVWKEKHRPSTASNYPIIMLDGALIKPHASEWSREFYSFVPPSLDQHYDAAFEQAFYNPLLSSSKKLEEQLTQMHENWAHEFTKLAVTDKGKAKLIEEDQWETQFKSAMEEGNLNLLEKETSQVFDNFEKAWKNASSQDSYNWEEEFSNSLNPVKSSYTEKEYQFEPHNPYLEHQDPYAEGIELQEKGGSLTEAALAFEAAVQKNPHHADAWARLGFVQAENEKEEPAISALQRAVKENPHHLEALMALAVSFTNEGYDESAFRMLDRWISVKYPQLYQKLSNGITDEMPSYELYNQVSEIYLAAARETSKGASIDPDVQVGLGILFYNSGQYDKAIDCFTVALNVRPRDYLLWNRLGATMANSGRSEEAIDAYFHALDIKPSFVRARYNLGVSCMNIGCYKEAVEHFLGALNMHGKVNEVAIKNISVNLWETLRRTLILMERKDLADMAVTGADLSFFKNEFDF